MKKETRKSWKQKKKTEQRKSKKAKSLKIIKEKVDLITWGAQKEHPRIARYCRVCDIWRKEGHRVAVNRRICLPRSPTMAPLWLTDWLLLYVVRRVTLTSPSCHASICHWRWLRHPRTTLCSLTCRSSDALSSSFHFYSQPHAHTPWVGPTSSPNVGPYSFDRTCQPESGLWLLTWINVSFI